MTDPIPIPNPAFESDDFMARYRAHELRVANLVEGNKASVMSALGAAGVTCVTVSFDGYGDSGQIEGVEVKAGDGEAVLPETSVEIARADYHSEAVTQVTLPLAEAIETLCYDLLETRHGGWENNGGAFGELVFDVQAGSATLDFNYRIETSENHSYAF